MNAKRIHDFRAIGRAMQDGQDRQKRMPDQDLFRWQEHEAPHRVELH